jgi:hypothetical protein
MKLANLLAALVGIAISGCVANPMNPDAFRTVVKDSQSRYFTSERYTVNRPLSQVTDTFKRKSKECLSFSLASTMKPTIGVGSSTHVYAVGKPTVFASPNRTSLHFQVKMDNVVGGQPPDGNYYLIADAFSAGGGKTRIQVYRYRSGLLSTAVRGWASGEMMGCPDQTKLLGD